MTQETQIIKKITDNCEKVIIGKREEIINILKGIIAEGNILIEDVPGVGKTTLIKAIAKSFSLNFKRIQFTTDLLPSDITGVSIYNQKTMEFEFKKGPAFTNILLADEINRATPRTQSALLEVMEEKQISEGNITYSIERPFFVLATQNSTEHQGTFKLPDAQMDRFIIRVKIGYPNKTYEREILRAYKSENPLNLIESVAKQNDLLYLQKKVKDVYVSEEIYEYLIEIVQATREDKYISLGASTRASLALLKIAQASALINGRDYVIPEDVKENVKMVLCHRIVPSPEALINKYEPEYIIDELLRKIYSPKIKYYASVE